MHLLQQFPIIGVSARITKRLNHTSHALDQQLAQWLGSLHTVPVLIPSMSHPNAHVQPRIGAREYAILCDGLVLQGGADVSPTHYGQVPRHPDWSGDTLDDAYDMALVNAFLEVEKPIFGICRGMQLLNVLFGGSLFQDVGTQRVGSNLHFTTDREKHTHGVTLLRHTPMEQWFQCHEGLVVSSHHQAVDRLADGLDVQGVSDDGLIEALLWRGSSFVAGVQWHPEFHAVHSDKAMLCSRALMDPFLYAVRERKSQNS